MKILAEMFAYAAFALVVGLLSAWPRVELIDAGRAIVSLAFSHAGERIGECRRISQEELNKLAPNMRQPIECPRERHSVRVELRSGATVLYSGTLLPSGVWSDGKVNIYRRIEIAAGRHDFFIGMNDSGGDGAFDFVARRELDVLAGRNIVVEFDELTQQFLIR